VRRPAPRPLAAATRALLAAVIAAALGGATLTGCTRSTHAAGSPSTTPDPAATLAGAKKALDAADAVHFTLSSGSTPKSATALLGGEGDVARPDRFSGGLDVLVAGQKLHVKVVSVSGTVYAQVFSTSWAKVQPAQFGVHDPGTLLAPQGGLGDLLTAARNPSFAGEKRRGQEVLREVRASIPGDTVARVLTSVDPSKPVPAVFGVDEASGQLREATLTGPFFDKAAPSTYTVALERYGEQVDIRAPTT
jgi:LppX_LprAFG lipoprotein